MKESELNQAIIDGLRSGRLYVKQHHREFRWDGSVNWYIELAGDLKPEKPDKTEFEVKLPKNYKIKHEAREDKDLFNQILEDDLENKEDE